MRWTARTIAVVGPNASGKTTQAQLLVNRLREKGYEAQYVHGLYYLSNTFPYANWIRERVGPRKLRTKNRETKGSIYRISRILFSRFSYLFALITIICVSVRYRNQIIVFDRYYHQFFLDVYGPTSGPLSCKLPVPWRTIYLEAEFDALRPRLTAMDQEIEDTYYAMVTDYYATCAKKDWLRYSAELPIATLHDRIFEEIYQDIRHQTNCL